MKSSGHEGGGGHAGPVEKAMTTQITIFLFVFYFYFLSCFGLALVGRTPVGSLKISYIYPCAYWEGCFEREVREGFLIPSHMLPCAGDEGTCPPHYPLSPPQTPFASQLSCLT